MYTGDFDVRSALSDAPIPALAFSSVDLRKVAMHSNEEHIEVRQQAREIFAPGLELNDVLHDQVIPCAGQSGQALVKTLEEAWPHLVHQEKGPSSSRRSGSIPLATNWSLEHAGTAHRACAAAPWPGLISQSSTPR
jgi:hypothetical protein